MSLRFVALVLLVLGPVASVTLAQQPSVELLPADRAIEQVIDHYLDAELKKANLQPAPPANDAALLRRLSLDLIGRIPTVAETAAYVASTDADKKAKLVDRLLASASFVRHQTEEFNTLLQFDEPGRKGRRQGALRDYLRASFAQGRSWDRIFRDLLLPETADAKAAGAEDFLKGRVKDLNRLTIDVSTTFFGVNVSCAQCHDHPHVPAWTQDHFYGMKSFFARTVDAGGFVGERDFGVVKYIPNKGQEKAAPVMFLTGKTIAAPGLGEPTKEEKKKEQERLDAAKKSKKAPAPPAFSLRAKLVETALEPGQRDYFARAIVNRLFHRFLGRGLVMPLDQMHLENPSSHPELLHWLARDVAEHGYDLRRLIRGLVLTSAYARSSRWDGEKTPEERYFAAASVRPLTPMQMAVSLRLATVDPESLAGDSATLEKRLEGLAKDAERFAPLFPQAGERFQVGVSEAMLFTNNEGLQKELLDGTATLAARLKDIPELEKRADLAIRSVLSRPPRAEEIEALTEYMRQRSDRPLEACRHVVWALLTSAEFRFNH
jgi:hypothetical protein